MRVRLAGHLALFLCAGTLTAREVPVSELKFGTPPGARMQPAVRVGRTGSLAAWVDERNGVRVVFATRLNSNGAPLDRTGIRLGDGRGLPQIVWNGMAWLVFWTAPDHSLAMARVEENGAATAPRRISDHAPPQDEAHSIVTNGSVIVAAHGGVPWSSQNGNLYVTVLSMDGDVISSTIVDTRTTHSPIAIAQENGFAVAWTFGRPGGGVAELDAIRLDSQGVIVDETPHTIAFANAHVDLARHGDGYFVLVVNNTTGMEISTFALHGDLSPASLPSITAVPAYDSYTLLTEIGGRAALVYREVPGEIGGAFRYVAVRFDDAGHESGRQPILTSADHLFDIAIDAGQSGFTAVWVAYRTPSMYSLRGVRFDANLQPVTAPRSLTESAPAQSGAAVAAGANEILVAWREGPAIHLGRIAYDGSRLPLEEVVLYDVDTFAAPALLFDGQRYVIAYVSISGELQVRFLEPRGALLYDVLRFDVGFATNVVTLARGRSSTLIAWRSDQGVNAASIEGTAISRTPRVVVSGSKLNGVAAAWNGEKFLVVWHQGYLDYDMTVYDEVMGLRVNEDLSTSGAEPRILLKGWRHFIESETALVARGSQWLVALGQYESIAVLRVGAGGTIAGTTYVAPSGRYPRLASDGNEALLAWTGSDGQTFKAAALNADGTLAPPNTTVQSPLPGHDFGWTSAAAMRGGTAMLTYSRKSIEAGSVTRAFLTLERPGGTVPRRRAVR